MPYGQLVFALTSRMTFEAFELGSTWGEREWKRLKKGRVGLWSVTASPPQLLCVCKPRSRLDLHVVLRQNV
jgi:hypothetical protein